MTTRKDQISSTGRGSSPAGPFRLYHRLMGMPPDGKQIERLVEIGKDLDIGLDDAAWGFVVLQEANLASVRASAERAIWVIKIWSFGILAAVIVLLGIAGLLISLTSRDAIAFAITQKVDGAVQRLVVNERTTCVAAYGVTYCDATQVLSASPDKRKIAIGVANLDAKSAARLAATSNLTGWLDWLMHVTDEQWQTVYRVLAAKSSEVGKSSRP